MFIEKVIHNCAKSGPLESKITLGFATLASQRPPKMPNTSQDPTYHKKVTQRQQNITKKWSQNSSITRKMIRIPIRSEIPIPIQIPIKIRIPISIQIQIPIQILILSSQTHQTHQTNQSQKYLILQPAIPLIPGPAECATRLNNC